MLFVLTADWQDVPDDAILPRDGWQARMDPNTGLRQARLLPEEGYLGAIPAEQPPEPLPKVPSTLEEFAAAVAAAGPRPGEVKANGQFLYVHCPEPGPEHDLHTATGEPGVSLWMGKGGEPLGHCRKCMGPKSDYAPADWLPACEAYAARLVARVGWQARAKRDVEVLRVHNYFDRDLRHLVVKKRVKTEDGDRPFWWDAAPLGVDLTRSGRTQAIRAEEFLAEHYPDFEHIHEALHWYGIENLAGDVGEISLGPLRLLKPDHLAICEGERDCDSFNALGLKGWFATCLSHPKPKKLCAHHLPLVNGAKVVVIPDKDTAGAEQAEHWAGLLWDRVESVGRCDLPLPGGKDKKDLTDWIEAGGTGAELLKLLADAEPWLEKPLTAAEERSVLTIGILAVRGEYDPANRTERGFYSRRYGREVRMGDLHPTRAILQALEAAREMPRDKLGNVKLNGAIVLWRNWKSALFGELLKQLPTEEETVSSTATREELEILITGLLARMATLNPGNGEQRHAIGSWALRYARMAPGRWRQVKTYPIWGRSTRKVSTSHSCQNW